MNLSVEKDNEIRFEQDREFMKLAIDLAKHGEGSVEPNPMVGCVLVRDGKVIGRGFHRVFGGPHAEVDAIMSLASQDHARGSTAYVSLEPCCHQGKTPPCTRALIASGVSRVVIAMKDPFAKVDGGGISELTDHGIDVSVGVMESEATQLLAPYLKRIRTGIPWVIAKWAMTMDGKIATVDRQSKWITGDNSRAEVHRLRNRVDAVIVGMGTVEADDPQLTTRLPEGEAPKRTAVRVVLCHHRVPSIDSKLIQTANQTATLLLVSRAVPTSMLEDLHATAVEIVQLDAENRNEIVIAALQHLGERGFTNVMIEGGGEIFSSFFSVDQIDEAHVFVGPKAFGSAAAPGPISGDGVKEVAQAWQFTVADVRQFDDDVRIIYRRKSDPLR
ncbi:bifunctional diaminohydroxyphosphoribosylaminopyrimidine deaminase/5-amino-6-(5-phosphoribosylamino)uracil reductase RibD [Rubripirellula amarantea]|uniref:bifunctional diaminohydroxyphosphoribosylaminopyrimidine deaminase/5-amino-6-(5-phosphoribosylamino)uracil reductase RibD n=1 Tax=Rubripirellula amarantea TaxID=2527999 RepID=UPI001F5F5367|nr:bifunctional diaminohydroxyphosphoribosylaminopyrimidine deaminase/5-amino-6-(5-phosphoribosylamino)uracil reductase RibD [Rubripirellula amarantea]